MLATPSWAQAMQMGSDNLAQQVVSLASGSHQLELFVSASSSLVYAIIGSMSKALMYASY